MDKILSIIIPTYNMEKYLEQCVSSFTASKYIDDLEVLIVNDGSRDNTLDIANKLAKACPQSVRVIDKENGGHGSAINCGAYQCSGKYFKVVDADDWVDTNELDKLIEKLFDLNVDCAICNYTEHFECENTTRLQDMTGKLSIGVDISIQEYIKSYRLAMHSVTYNTERYREGNIKLTEKCFYVDTEFIYFPLAVFETVVCYPFNVYQYRLQREGQSVSRDGFLKHIEEHRKVMLELCEFYNSFNADKADLKQFLENELARHLSYQQSFLISSSIDKQGWRDHKDFVKKIKSVAPRVYAKMPFKRRALNTLNDASVRLLAKLKRR